MNEYETAGSREMSAAHERKIRRNNRSKRIVRTIILNIIDISWVRILFKDFQEEVPSEESVDVQWAIAHNRVQIEMRWKMVDNSDDRVEDRPTAPYI